jgi:hypothetical protein
VGGLVARAGMTGHCGISYQLFVVLVFDCLPEALVVSFKRWVKCVGGEVVAFQKWVARFCSLHKGRSWKQSFGRGLVLESGCWTVF